MEPVPARGAVLQEAEVDELVQGVPGVPGRHPTRDRREGGVEVPARYHGQPPEHPPCGICELLVRHPERAGDLQVAGLELIQTALLVRQPGSEFGGIPSGPADEPVPDDPQRQRQALAQLGEPGKR